ILKSPSSPLFRLINKSRRYRGINLINVLEEDMYRSAVKALNRNEIVGILIDTAALESRYQILSFLGHNVPAATGWLTLAQRTQAPVIPTISWREGKKIVITFGEPLVVSNTNRNEVISKIKTFFENFIKAHPEQWGMFLNAYETKRVLAGK
ncbi:MAG: lysophospholipid acyltransferase family protein, partial [Candidatus Margulisiibacteriota bacterium]